jgi:HTH-type transcriptional regulator / antitoxin HigA
MTVSTPDYPQLLAKAHPRSIRTDVDAERLRSMIHELIDLPRRLTPAEEDLLAVLGDLLSVWEGARYPIEDAEPLEHLRVMMEERSVSQSDLVRAGVFPTRSVASATLSGKRPLSHRSIEKLAHFFGVSPALFLASGGRP